MKRTTLFFDLDGTLIDSAVGITRCVAHALARLDHPVPPEPELRRWIGPPLRTSFAPLLVDPERVEHAVAHYRDRFESHGWAEHEVYAGIGETLDALHAAGHRLAVVTAKNEPYARKILAHLPFGDHFEDIIGASPAMREIFGVIQRVAKTDATLLIQGESGTGKELVARALHRLSCFHTCART